MADVVVVDDSKFMRVQIQDLLEDGGHSVVAEARNGEEAVDIVSETDPDIVTMDVKMPGMGGIEAVERIMQSDPTPILMLSRYTEDGAETTFDALDAGAVDFFRKPDGEISMSLVQYADDLVEKIDVVARANVHSAEATGTVSTPADVASIDQRSEEIPTLVVAASTGGPSVVESILTALPAELECRGLVVQHMPEDFTGRFAERLDGRAAFTVREAMDGDHLSRGEIVVAPGGYHLEITAETGAGLALELTKDRPVHSVRPAADVTLETAAQTVTEGLIGVVVSGMGHDAVSGLARVREAGGTTIAQDPSTARIDGMPRRAIEAEAIDSICSPEEIPARIIDSIRE